MIHAILSFPGILLLSFLPWYYGEYPVRIFRQYIAYAKAFLEIISIVFLIKTFLSPWKSIVDEYPKNLTNIGEIAQVFTLNCTTRIIGMIFRTVALSVAIILHAALIVLFTVYLVLWLSYPGILIVLAYLSFS
ncbi:hypothetical protein HN512_01285 [Candidatus Peregrinibacteria bacterium]|jgi:hypothetical protein|nr:hypothetical protein [Candidatus Peregrinibacteria bacterium]MBT3598450.1 hypothetical protein [Candidatus Peregrinibacteria bacterium]MBT4367111.1 hypothetical protein [Candidatus Peregrinibacteria bacterium]MBT4585463.1 hypothetical protein [Candidatus Peregrinibacteria bacterium]MBT6730881.1 hypothetical protein [Candidatus Peregrinibacteria bacterium]